MTGLPDRALRAVGEMRYTGAMRNRPPPFPLSAAPVSEPYLRMWRSLTPAQRLRRAWRLRARLRDIAAIHDAKTFPKL